MSKRSDLNFRYFIKGPKDKRDLEFLRLFLIGYSVKHHFPIRLNPHREPVWEGERYHGLRIVTREKLPGDLIGYIKDLGYEVIQETRYKS